MPMDFDPNKLGGPQPLWATYVPYRSPEFKMHKQRGHALSAVFHSNYILYQWNNTTNRWDEIFRLEDWQEPKVDDDPICEFCKKGIPTYGERYPNHSYDSYYKEKLAYKHDWVRDRNKIVSPPRVAVMCIDCYNTQRGY